MPPEKIPQLSEKEIAEALKFGGADEPEEDDALPIGCDKPHHFLCSLFHQKNHIKHAKEILKNQKSS